jgi:hypothetical protein
MCDLFQINFVRPNYNMIKQTDMKGVQLYLVNMLLFLGVAKNYK